MFLTNKTKPCGTLCRKTPSSALCRKAQTEIWAKLWALLLLSLFGLSLGVSLEARGSKSGTDDTALIGKAEADIFNETGYPIVKKPITLSGIFYTHPLAIEMDNMPTVQRIKQKVGIELDIEQVPGDQYSEKINLLFASGDLPDIIFNTHPSGVMNYTEMLRPTERYIDRFMPNFRKMLEKRPQLRPLIRFSDGKTYSLAMGVEHSQYETPGNLFINKKWLDALGLPIPETTEQFYRTLQAFKTRDPNGNGKADEIPISLTGGGWYVWSELHTLAGSFTFPFDSRYLKVNRNGKLEFVPLTEEEGFLRFVEYWQKIYREGLADVETYTQSEHILAAKAKEGIIGVFTAWFDENILGNEGVADYVFLKPLKGPGKSPQWLRSVGQFARVFLLPKSNAYPASTMRLMDLGFDPDWAWQITYGPWDIVLEKRADGSVVSLPAPAGVSEDEWRFRNTPGNLWPTLLLSEQLDKWIGPNNHQRKAVRHKALEPYLPAPEEYLPQLSLTLDEQTELGVLSTDINDFFTQQYVNWITQGTNVREAWPDFVRQLKRIGLERYVAIYQAAYDRAMNK